jgi:hypothetical protein
MKLENVEKLLQDLEIPLHPRETSGVFVNFQCPFAPFYHKKGIDSHPSFGISVSPEKRSYYTCFSCQQKGSLALLPAKLGKLRGVDYKDLIDWAERAEFSDIGSIVVPEWDEQNPSKVVNERAAKKEITTFGSAIGHPYLKKRGYSWYDAVKLDLQFDEAQQRILFPVYNNRLQLEGYTGRSVMPDRLITKGKGTNPKSRDYFGLQKERLFLYNRRFNGSQRIILVEGPFDYARLVQAGYYGAHAILGTALTDYKINLLLELNKPVFLFLDNDAAGDAATFGVVNNQTHLRENTHLSWANRLVDQLPVWICQYPKSAEIEGRNDPDSLTIQEIKNAVQNAWLYTGLFSLPEYSNNSDIPF